ncbi:MAG: SagB/ThcOx family dehydrogenase [Sulfolobales archaeon]|jgi:SagB-type dehydrogenase family enzyme
MSESELFEKLLSEYSSEFRRVIRRGLEKSLSKKDPTMIYHFMSMISPETNIDLLYEFDYYYKIYRVSERIKLPKPLEISNRDVLEVIRSRRSRRRYSYKPIDLVKISTILYHAVGVTGRAWWGGPKRVYPSAGALQPVEAYLVASRVEGIENGLYHYNPGEHSLELLKKGSFNKLLREISLDQDHVERAAANIILTIVYRRTASKYGLRAYRYAHLDAGFAGQNIYLVAEALDLATVAVGAFLDEELCNFLEIDCIEEFPVLIFPIGERS